MRIHPFRALRPSPARAPDVASVPYDVVDRDEAMALAEGLPTSFLRVVRPDIELDAGADGEQQVQRAAQNLAAFIEDAVLVRDATPRIYLYRQIMGEHAQTGIVTCCHVADYDAGVVKKHEFTRRDKEDDRARHVATLNANTGPVFLTFRDDAAVSALMTDAMQAEPETDFEAPDGVRHSVWPIDEPEAWVAAFGAVPASYIADGHHRAASAARVGRERRATDPDAQNAEFDWFLTVLFPASELKILSYNRCVQDLNGQSAEELLGALSDSFDVQPDAGPTPQGPGAFQMYLAGRWYGLRPLAPPPDDPVARLDVSILQDRLLAPFLGIDDPRSSSRIAFIGGIRGTDELERRVDAGRDAIAFSMHATTIDDLMSVADADSVMPPKSTWFEPKLRSGLFVHTL